VGEACLDHIRIPVCVVEVVEQPAEARTSF
jgi:hypothetical protein